MNKLVDKLKSYSKSVPREAIYSSQFIDNLLLILIIIFIPFSPKFLFDTSWSYVTGTYSHFTSFFLYISDFFIFALIIKVFLSTAKKYPVNKLWKASALIFIGWIALELYLHNFTSLELYLSIRLVSLVLFAFAVSKMSVPREKIAWTFTILGAVQALIAFFQFTLQQSVGLYKLGESHLTIGGYGVAKIAQEGITMIRGYGTFPHANVLGGFLVITTLFNLYLLNKSLHGTNPQTAVYRWQQFGLNLLLFFNIFGVFISFSRGALIALGSSILLCLGIYLLNKQYSALQRTIVSCGTIIIVCILILAPVLSTRLTTTDQASLERITYNSIGLAMIQSNPISGFGVGQSMLHMKQFAESSHEMLLKPWEIQPIHNFWLISAADLGLGSIFLVFLVLFPLLLIIKGVIKKPDPWVMTLVTISVAILLLFLIDHYFYTIWPMGILLWLILGLSMATVPREAISSKSELI